MDLTRQTNAVGTVVLHHCSPGCGHKHLDHSRVGGECSYGYCPCTATQAEVIADNPGAECPTYAMSSG